MEKLRHERDLLERAAQTSRDNDELTEHHRAFRMRALLIQDELDALQDEMSSVTNRELRLTGHVVPLPTPPAERPQVDRRAVLEAPFVPATPIETPTDQESVLPAEKQSDVVARPQTDIWTFPDPASEPVSHIPAPITQGAEPAAAASPARAPSLFGRTGAPQPASADDIAHVLTLEWLGPSFYRFISPQGKAILVNPRVDERDLLGIGLDLVHADFVFLTDAHQEPRDVLRLAQRTGSRLATASWVLQDWLVRNGLPESQILDVGAPGDRLNVDGLVIRVVSREQVSGNGHADGKPPSTEMAASFMLTFEDGWTVYLAGDGVHSGDLELLAQMYRPITAVLPLGAAQEPADFAMQVKRLKSGSPVLSEVYVNNPPKTSLPGVTTLDEAQAAIDAMQVGLFLSFAGLEQPVTLRADRLDASVPAVVKAASTPARSGLRRPVGSSGLRGGLSR